ncbi:BTAD domain-containing putative transcriptional regulator [Nonomuraea sp. NPDC049486]|uniref:AfsR/SARP family transcriptional regulator n=1 Tax=Nonomuraea sp. NPDC049486 TaxID=3155773 RepID=UPI003432A392
MIEFVWGPAGCEPAALHSAVYRLREWLRLTGIGVVREGGGYRIEVPPEQVDASRFRIAVASAREERDPGRRTDLLFVALDLWRGPVLAEDLEWPHVLPAAAELQQTRIDSARELAEAAVRCGRAADAIDHLERLAKALPYDETIHSQLITLLGHAGRRAEGLRHYELIRRHLADELGVDPGPGLRRAHVALLGGDLPVPGPPLPPVCLLPYDLPDFTGRQAELDRITTVLSAEADITSTVAICGMPGVGKTALAVRAGHLLRSRFPDGQLFADVNGPDGRPAEVAQVLGRWLRVLGEQPNAIPDGQQERAELLRARLAGRRVLIVLDNVADAGQIQSLLPTGPSCAAILTSRTDLAALYGMTCIRLPVMPPSEAVALLKRLIGDARTEAEPEPVRRLIEACGHLPLALRIAGARLAARPHWTVTRLTDQFERAGRPLDHLTLGAMEVRAVLAVGYRSLDEPARRLLRLLGLLEMDDVAAWVGAALLDSPLADAEELMERLADAHLLEAVRPLAGDQIRYRPHDLVRAFARERAEAEETPTSRDSALARALGGWLALTEYANDGLWGGDFLVLHGGTARWRPQEGVEHLMTDPLGWCDAEWVNIVAAVGQAARTGASELCWDLAGSALHLFEARGRYDEWRQVHALALAAARQAGDDTGVAVMSTAAALVDIHQHRYDSAVAEVATATELFERLGERRGLALATVIGAWIDYMRGTFDGVLSRIEKALAVVREAGDRGGEFLVLACIGELHLQLGRPDRALTAMERAHAVAHVSPGLGPHPQARALWFVAQARLAVGDFHRAEADLSQIRCYADQHDAPHLQAYALYGLGLIRLRHDRLLEAEPLLRRALTLSTELDERRNKVHVLLALGELHRRRAAFDAALACLTEALSVGRDMRAPLWQADMLHALAALHQDMGDVEAAAAERLQAETLLQQSERAAAAE